MMVANSANSNPQEIAAANEHLIEKFVKLHAANVVKATSTKYGGMLRELAAYYPDRLLSELDEDDLTLFFVYLRDERLPLDPKGQPLPSRTPRSRPFDAQGLPGSVPALLPQAAQVG